MLLRCWLRCAGCLSQEAYLLHQYHQCSEGVIKEGSFGNMFICAGSASGPQPVFGASPMGLLPGGEKRGLLSSSTGISNGEKKPPLLSHKLTGAEITAVRQLITGYRYGPENDDND